MFAPRHRACIITEQGVRLYVDISNQLSKKMEYTLYSVLRVMVDAYFDDENEYERLIAMLNENTSVEVAERFVSLEIMHNDLEVAKSDLEEAYSDLEEAQSDLEVANSNLKVANSNLEVANSNLKEAQSDLEGAESRIRELEAEVEDLKKQLNSKYI